jgi:hypothetical protein
MHPRIRRWTVLACGVIAFVSLGAGRAAAQGDVERLQAELAARQQRYQLLQQQLLAITDQGQDLRRNRLVAVKTVGGVVFTTREGLIENLKQAVIARTVSEWRTSGDYGRIGRLADENWIAGQAAALERALSAESESVLHDLVNSKAQIEAELRLLRDQMADLEERIGQLTGTEGRGRPPGSGVPSGVFGQWAPASRRVCPSPLFGKLLYSAAGARCVGDEDILLPGWRFGEKAPLVCAHCTPNCAFAEEPSGRLICVVTGAAGAPPGPPAAGRPPAPRPPRGAPSPAGRPEDLSARKKALSQELERLRLAGRWSPDHHYQVGVWLGNASTSAQLDAIEILINDYAACYERSNTERDRIGEAARAGRYRTPGERIGALDAVSRALNACIDAAKARRQAAIGR